MWQGSAASRPLIRGEISDDIDHYHFSTSNNNIFMYAPNYDKAFVIFEQLVK